MLNEFLSRHNTPLKSSEPSQEVFLGRIYERIDNILGMDPSTQKIGEIIRTEVKGWSNKKYEALMGLTFDNVPEIKPAQIVYQKDNSTGISGLILLPYTGETPFFLTNLKRALVVLEQTKLPFGLAAIYDNPDNMFPSTSGVKELLDKAKISSYIVLSPNGNYLAALKSALEALVRVGLEIPEYLGFLDDDAYLFDNHYNEMVSSLGDPRVFAVSGMAVDGDNGNLLHDDFFNIPSIDDLDAALKKGYDLTKPHIHGGGGGCLMRGTDFVECLDIATVNNFLLGPTISVYGRARNLETPALHNVLVRHPTKDTFYNWLKMVLRYYRTWGNIGRIIPFDNAAYEIYLNREKEIFGRVMPHDKFTRWQVLKTFRRSFKNLFL